MADVVTELVQLVNAYHWRWTMVHGDHGVECELCSGLHARHEETLASFDELPDEPLEAAGLMAAECFSCQAPLVWVMTERGRRMPLDPDPYVGDDPRGLFVLRRHLGAGPVAVAATPDAFPGEPVYRSHFATCPNAKEHRR